MPPEVTGGDYSGASADCHAGQVGQFRADPAVMAPAGRRGLGSAGHSPRWRAFHQAAVPRGNSAAQEARGLRRKKKNAVEVETPTASLTDDDRCGPTPVTGMAPS